jgi:hypothetical protein
MAKKKTSTKAPTERTHKQVESTKSSTTVQLIFMGFVFYIEGFTDAEKQDIRTTIRKNGGKIIELLTDQVRDTYNVEYLEMPY